MQKTNAFSAIYIIYALVLFYILSFGNLGFSASFTLPNNPLSDDASLYYQFSYALTQLMGYSDKRIPKQTDYAIWLTGLEPAANAA